MSNENPVLTELTGAADWANSPHSQLLVSRMRAAIARLKAKKDHKCSCGGECSNADATGIGIAREHIRMLGIIIAEIEGAAGRDVGVWDGAPLPAPSPDAETAAA